MNGRVHRSIRYGVTIVGAMVAIAALVLGRHEVAGLVAAYRFAAFACLGPCVGSLIFVLIHRLTGGQWAERLLPFLARGVALLPWMWLLTLPLLWLQPERFQSPPDASASLRAYFSHAGFVTRGIAYGVVFALYALATRRVLAHRRAMPWFGPAGLIVLVFMLHLLGVDWFAALEPGWYSTGFGFVWMTAQAIAGLSAAIGSGARPTLVGSAGRPHGLDWGNLLLAAVMAWTYVAFTQFLIIWSGDLPPEISWYLRRGHGGWRIVAALLALLQFATPVALLLSRGVKQSARWLGGVALLLLAGQIAYTAWLVLPAFPATLRTAQLCNFALAAAALALFWLRYAAVAPTRPSTSEEVA